jgi:hypothetical protein
MVFIFVKYLELNNEGSVLVSQLILSAAEIHFYEIAFNVWQDVPYSILSEFTGFVRAAFHVS